MKLSYDDLADLYKERTGGRARIMPMQSVVTWALTQPDITEDKDGYLIRNPEAKSEA